MKALPVSPTVGGVRVLGTGLNRWDDSAGTWVPAEAGFEGTPDGEYVARHTAHQVILARNLNTDGAVDLLTPDGQRLRSTPVGLAYRESGSDRTALLAEVRDCRGKWVSPTEILYPDAFDGLAADVRFTIGLDRFEQDVIFRAAPPGPQRFGLDPSRTQLVVLTEFHEAPSPAQAEDEAPGWLRFGAMAMAPGRAFLTGTPTGRVGADDQGLAVAAGPSPADSVPVVKSWEVMEGRAFLVEAVEYSAVAAALTGLPSARQAAAEPKAASAGCVLPAPRPGRVASRGVWPDRIQEMPATEAPCLAASPPDRVGAERPGLVLDYVLLTSQTSLTLAGDTTYYVTGSVNVQNLTIEGGTVVKYDTPSSARISVSSSVTCRTGPYRPAFFTHKFDSTVGEPVATGDPTASYVGYPMLSLSPYVVTLDHLRFRHAQTALTFNSQQAPYVQTARHLQWVRCAQAISAYGTSYTTPLKLSVGNALAANVGMFLNGSYFNASCEHLTADGVNLLVNAASAYSALAVTNSILANVTNLSSGTPALSGTHNGFWNCQQFGSNPIFPAPGNPFQIVGGGSRYLTSTAPFRGAGTQNINSTLLGHLRAWGTTQPPSEWTIPIVAETLWAPRATRSQGAPDLGYHYEALDYALTDLAINDASLTLTNGVAVATHGWRGLKPGTGGQLVSIGEPDRLNVITRYNTVQEQYGSSWDYAGWTTLLYPPQTAATPAPQVTCRFTRLTAPAYGRAINGPGVGTYWFTDCQFAGGELSLDTLATGTSGMSLTLKNCLLEGVSGSFTDHHDPVSLTVRNCTFWRGHAWFSPGEVNTFLVRDTFFDATVIAQSTVAVDHDYNGYVTGQSRLTPAAPHDVPPLAASPAYATGPLGNRYLPTTCALRDAGSQADAALAGLYHHTTYAANQTREQNTRVDVGFHYVGCTANQPTDTDADTLPDYLEDTDGDGQKDANETALNDADTDYDGCLDGEELAEWADPLNPDSFIPKRLAYWRFNNSLNGEQGQTPLVSSGVTLEASFDGQALKLNGPGSFLKYRDVEANGLPNLNLQRGSVRLWFKPGWTLSAAPDWTRLLHLGANSTDWFSIYWRNPAEAGLDSVRLRLGSWAGGIGSDTYLDMPINEPCVYPNPAAGWNTPQWHWITVTWDEPQAWAVPRLFLEGRGTADWRPDFVPCPQRTWINYGGSGIPSGVIPAPTVRVGGFALGSDLNGNQQANGLVDEVEVFNYPIGVVEHRRGDQFLASLTASATTSPSSSITVRRACGMEPDPQNPYQVKPQLVSVWRREAGAGAFSFWIPATDATEFTDTAVIANLLYEYALGAPNDPFTAPLSRQITAGLELDPVHHRGRVILLVEDKLLLPGPNDLRPEIERLRADLVGDGWRVTPPLSAPRHDDATGRDNYTAINLPRRQQVESLIAANAEPGVPNVIFLLGHVVIPYSGRIPADGHAWHPDCHGGPWVCDGYYGSLDKTLWTDQANIPKPDCNWAIPNDGCFDQDYLPSLDYVVGRIDFARLPALIGADYLAPSVDTEEELEVALLRQYLAKNHRYRMGSLPLGPRIAAWEANGAFGDANEEAARAAGPLFGLEYGTLFTGVAYELRVPCAIAFMYSTGQPDRQSIGGNTWFTASDLKWQANEPTVLIYNLEASWFPDWNWHTDNLMRALLATPTCGLACTAWSRWGFDRLAVGGMLGEAMLHRHTSAPLHASASILGDPTLRVVHLSPARSVSGQRQGNSVTLRWVAAAGGETSYYVYRSSSGLEGFGTPLNPLPLVETQYTDSNSPAGSFYMVRPCRLVTSGAGSYFDLGQGAFVAVP